MDELCELVISQKASDLHIEVGAPPVLRIDGNLMSLDVSTLGAEDTEKLVQSITSEEQQRMIKQDGTVDFGFNFKDKARFRVSAFKQKGCHGAVLRLIPNEIMEIDEIGLQPQITKNLLYKPSGLMLITGPTGSGKSTTLASMIDLINRERNVHIVTIEDPIEFYHSHKKGLIIQREVGKDVPDFSTSLVKSLRQDPDVILVGEMRNIETIRAAITAAETGHLVLSTLHTVGAAKTIDRIIDSFPQSEQDEVRMMLSTSMNAVISQVLLKREDQERGRIAAFETMISTPSIQSLIRENKTYMINSEIQTGGKWGMQMLDDKLMELFKDGKISYTDLITKAKYPDIITQKLKELKE